MLSALFRTYDLLLYDTYSVLSYVTDTHQYWPKKFDINDMMPLKKAPDIFMSHVQDSASIDRLMPKSEAVYFTAVRDPVTLLESAFNYFNLSKESLMSKVLPVKLYPLSAFHIFRTM